MKYNVSSTKLELSAIIDLKGSEMDVFNWLPKQFPPAPEQPNTSSTNDHCEIYWVGPGHWLLRTGIEKEKSLIDQIDLNAVPGNISAVLISDSLIFFSLSGPQVDEVIAQLCPLDIHPDKFPDSAVSYTEVFGLKALLIRREFGFELAVDRSYADMMADVLNRAGASVG